MKNVNTALENSANYIAPEVEVVEMALGSIICVSGGTEDFTNGGSELWG